MGILSNKTPPATYIVPKLVDVDPEYGSRVARLKQIQSTLGDLHREQDVLDGELSSMPAPSVRPAVAALVGDDVVDERGEKRRRLAELRTTIADHSAAVDYQRRRIDEVKGPANIKICDVVRPEYGRRVASLVAALQTVAAAREELEQLTEALTEDGVSWTRLGVFTPTFLGDRRDGHIHRLTREAKEAGYYGN